MTLLLAAALTPAWAACVLGWAAWVAVHAVTGGFFA